MTNHAYRLCKSIDELECAIEQARHTLSKRLTISSIYKDALKKLDNCTNMITKQRQLSTKLCVAIDEKDWEEVSDYVKIINGLSAMIRDEARDAISLLTGETQHTNSQYN